MEQVLNIKNYQPQSPKFYIHTDGIKTIWATYNELIYCFADGYIQRIVALEDDKHCYFRDHAVTCNGITIVDVRDDIDGDVGYGYLHRFNGEYFEKLNIRTYSGPHQSTATDQKFVYYKTNESHIGSLDVKSGEQIELSQSHVWQIVGCGNSVIYRNQNENHSTFKVLNNQASKLSDNKLTELFYSTGVVQDESTKQYYSMYTNDLVLIDEKIGDAQYQIYGISQFKCVHQDLKAIEIQNLKNRKGNAAKHAGFLEKWSCQLENILNLSLEQKLLFHRDLYTLRTQSSNEYLHFLSKIDNNFVYQDSIQYGNNDVLEKDVEIQQLHQKVDYLTTQMNEMKTMMAKMMQHMGVQIQTPRTK
ncbi:Hypothetical_protein [Hexamita inflata]|uniref:Hypothetical_protein n=1 Tax=Hexamita inflata TaxID=28002 RepID=A0AA86UDE5_9EUKA|nr:Hypothetical protein HINF_LOCUS38909 [Hexamita inflata]